jgi:gamma-glutamylcyclotransferase (GGCT)/AIG2-like uncharacterized protein YtfP
MGNTEHIFVYGRLRTGFWNQFLLGNRNPLGTARTVHKYALYASEIPYVRTDRPVSPVRGDVYAATPRMLQDLDSLMAHPAWYRRHKVPVRLDDGRELLAWMYVRPGVGGVLVESGDLLDRPIAAGAPEQE